MTARAPLYWHFSDLLARLGIQSFRQLQRSAPIEDDDEDDYEV
jgi:hypothetical protein